MKPLSLCLSAVATVVLFISASCTTPLTDYRTQATPNSPTGVTVNPLVSSNYVFSVIEFDDMGQLWSEEPLTNSIHIIQRIKRHGWPISDAEMAGMENSSTNQLGRPVVLVVFVHGWNHDASDGSQNFKDFHEFTKRLANALPHLDKGNGPSPVLVSTYIGWRGALYDTTTEREGYYSWNFPLNALRFHNRKAAAERVAGPAATAAILSLCAAAKTDLSGVSTESRVLIIGHSLGGLIVERAVSQAMIGGILIDRPAESRAQLDRVNLEILHGSKTTKRVGLEGEMKELARGVNILPEDVSADWALIQTNICATTLAASMATILERSAAASNRVDTLRQVVDGSANRLGDHWTNFANNLRALRLTLDQQSTNWTKVDHSFAQLVADIQNQVPKARFTQNPTNILKNISDRGKRWQERNDTDASSLSANFFPLLTNHVEVAKSDLGPMFDAYRTHLSRLTETQTDFQEFQAWAKTEQTMAESVRDACVKEVLVRWNHHLKRAEWMRTTNEIYQIEAQLAETARRSLHRPADLIILANPASEAITAKKMVEAFTTNPLLNDSDLVGDALRPLIISVSSEADNATRTIFPLAMRAASMTKEFRDETQESLTFHTGPHLGELHTHRINMVQKEAAIDNEEVLMGRILRENLSNNGFGQFEFISTTSGNDMQLSRFELTPNTNSVNRTGYWIVGAPSSLISDHNDIFSHNFYGLVTGLYRASGLDIAPDIDTLKAPPVLSEH